MEEIDLREFLATLRKRIWIIALVTVLFMGLSWIISNYILEPEYQTYTTMMIGRPKQFEQKLEYNDVLLNQKLISTYGEIAKSRIIAEELIANLELNLSYEELSKKVNVTLLKDTEIIKISVKDKDGRAAAQIANEIASVFMKHIAKIMNIENIQVIDKAEIPIEPYKPKPIKNMVLAAVLGVALSMVSIFMHEYFDDTIKTSADIEKSLGLPIIGIIPKVT